LVVGTVFAISIFLLVNAWVQHNAETSRPVPAAAAPVNPTPTPTLDKAPLPAPTSGQAPASAGVQAPGSLAAGERIQVRTDYLAVEIDTAGGDLRRVEFLKHRDRDDHSRPFVLLEAGSGRTYVAQSGLIGEGLPNHTTRYSAERNAYELGQDARELVVRLTAQAEGGAEVVKTYTFRPSSYVVEVRFDLTNRAAADLSPYAYYQLLRDAKPPQGDSKLVPTFSGAEVYTNADKLTKVTFEDISEGKAKFPSKASDGWVAFVQHYFLAAWLPEGDTQREYFLRAVGEGLISGGVIVPVGSIAPGHTSSVAVPLYVGPQEQDQLEQLAPGLELAVDYGWLRVLAVPLFWVLKKVNDFVGNWGIAIIVLTILIKLAFYPLSAASYRSMARMKVLAPKLQRLKERYGEDRQKMHEAMMELYKTEKINPLGGCLPILVQIPVFIALYWVLLLSVELRQAPFALWIVDLSTPDPYYVLPVLMGATMFLQTWLSPAPPDPMQARLMKIMPVAFSVFFFFFPSGLVLYWLVNNILSIAQQWQITRSMERSTPAHGDA
jgi:YidC/Oxa1 family membrane protein insertase